MAISEIDGHDISQYTVLIVDDISLNTILLQKFLSQFTCQVASASGGQQALDIIAENKPALILLDIMMPGIDGLMLLQMLRANPAYADIRIVMVSAANDNENVMKALSLGANDFISKPINLAKFTNCVTAQLKAYIEGQQK
ncbi:MAG: response regulator [Bacteroidales bacterium]|nr:response regulator [Bacteroidales bacterium]